MYNLHLKFHSSLLKHSKDFEWLNEAWEFQIVSGEMLKLLAASELNQGMWYEARTLCCQNLHKMITHFIT